MITHISCDIGRVWTELSVDSFRLKLAKTLISCIRARIQKVLSEGVQF